MLLPIQKINDRDTKEWRKFLDYYDIQYKNTESLPTTGFPDEKAILLTIGIPDNDANN